MLGTVLILLAGLELKHYVADYLLQPRWLLRGKGSIVAAGGYVHAGIHVLGSLAVLVAARVPLGALLALLVAEFGVHYLIDYVKYRYFSGIRPEAMPARYWAVHGFDQLLHQLTYAGMIGFALLALGP